MTSRFLTRVWWSFNASADWFAQPYHWLNLIEGCFWLVLAALVSRRWWKNRNSPLELLYAAAFFTFGLSDFREAHALETWLILAKGLNLLAILLLRKHMIQRYYPDSRTY